MLPLKALILQSIIQGLRDWWNDLPYLILVTFILYMIVRFT